MECVSLASIGASDEVSSTTPASVRPNGCVGDFGLVTSELLATRCASVRSGSAIWSFATSAHSVDHG
jgi:hypothetical protein